MLTTPLFQLFLKHVRYVGLGALLVILPVSGRASIITEEIDFTVNGATGEVTFTVDTNPGDPSHSTSDAPGGGDFADPNDGLLSLTMQYNGVNYGLADFLDTPALPIILLPGNSKLHAGLNYELIGAVAVDGSCTGSAGSFTCTGSGPGNSATILGFSPSTEVALVGGVLTVDASVAGSSTTVHVFGQALTPHAGSITGESSAVPEPGLAPISAAALAGLWFVRRRKATKA